MGFVPGIGGVLLIQLGVSYGVILAGTGGGSFVGLGAMLLALIGIPLTALINFFVIRSGRNQPGSRHALRVVLIASVLPALQLALLVVVSVFQL